MRSHGVNDKETKNGRNVGLLRNRIDVTVKVKQDRGIARTNYERPSTTQLRVNLGCG